MVYIFKLDIFGNAHFFNAFTDINQYEGLKKALNCYEMAEKYQKQHKNPDLYHNRAMVHLYLENYDKGVNDLLMADSIDINLKAGELADKIIQNISLFARQIKNECGIKQKKKSQIIANIPSNINTSSGYDLSDIESWRPDVKKILISAKIIAPIIKNVEIPISMICMDHKGFFFVLSVYHLSKDFSDQVKIGISNVVILDPEVIKCSFCFNNKTYEYNLIKVPDPNKLVLDGKYSSCYTSSSELNSTFFT